MRTEAVLLAIVLVCSILLAGHATALTYTESSTGLIPPSMEGGHTELEFADVNADGNVDLLSIGDHGSPYINTDQHGIMVWFGDGLGSWSVFQNGNFGYGGIAVGDVNGDGLLDVGYGMHHDYSSTDFGNQLIEVALGDGTGMNWVPWDDGLATSGETWGMFGTDFADVDNDGGLDLACLNSGAPEVWVWDDAGEAWVDFSGNLPTSGSYSATALHDMDVDGYIDLVAFGNGTVSIWLGDGAGMWTTAAAFAVPGTYEAFRVGGDFDRNGFPDMALLDEEGSWPSYQNHLRCYREASVALGLTIAPVFPRGHERIAGGSVQFIDWISAVPAGMTTTVALDYSTSGPSGPWFPIASGLPNNGRHQWTMPDVNSTNCYIRYTVTGERQEEVAVTPAAFTVLGDEVGVDDGGGSRVALSVRPNPATGTTTIHYTLESPGPATLAVYDAAGRRVARLAELAASQTGEHQVAWNGRDDSGERVAAGVYFCRLEADGEVVARKIVFVR
jgi:hypothetical protein